MVEAATPAASDAPAQGEWYEWAHGWRDRHGDGLTRVRFDGVASQITVLDGVLTIAECERLVARAEAGEWLVSDYGGKVDVEYRRGRRAPLLDATLADTIFARIQAQLAPRLLLARGAPLWRSTPQQVRRYGCIGLMRGSEETTRRVKDRVEGSLCTAAQIGTPSLRSHRVIS